MEKFMRLALCAIALFVAALASASTANAQIATPTGWRTRISLNGHVPQLVLENASCLVTEGYVRTCASTDVLVRANESRRSAAREARRRTVQAYRTQMDLLRLRRSWMEARTAMAGTTDDMQMLADRTRQGTLADQLHSQAVGMISPVFQIACPGSEDTVHCLPSRQSVDGIDVINGIQRIARNLGDAENVELCRAACMSSPEQETCIHGRLGTLMAMDWTRPYNRTAGSAQRCTPSADDSNCRQRPVNAFSVYTCESILAWHAQVSERLERMENDRSRQTADESNNTNLANLVLTPAQQAGHENALADRVAQVEADVAALRAHPAAEATPPAATAPAAAPTPPAPPERGVVRATRRTQHRRHTAHSGRMVINLPSPQVHCVGPRNGFLTCTENDPVSPQNPNGLVHELLRTATRVVPMSVRRNADPATVAAINGLQMSPRLVRPSASSENLTGAVAALVAANMGNDRRACSSPIYVTCRNANGAPISRRRLGVCPLANGGVQTRIELRDMAIHFVGLNCRRIDLDLVPNSTFRIPVGQTSGSGGGSSDGTRANLSQGPAPDASVRMALSVSPIATVASLATPAPSGRMNGSPNRVEPPPPVCARLACDILRRETCIPPCLVAADAAFNRIRTAAALGRRPRTFLAA